jgi:hypothetical protein
MKRRQLRGWAAAPPAPRGKWCGRCIRQQVSKPLQIKVRVEA